MYYSPIYGKISFAKRLFGQMYDRNVFHHITLIILLTSILLLKVSAQPKFLSKALTQPPLIHATGLF